MPNPPSKGGMERSSTPIIKIPPSSSYQTRATTQAAASTKTDTQQNEASNATKSRAAEPSKEPSSSNKQKSMTLQLITEALKHVIAKEKLEKTTKALLEGILKFIRETEESKKKKAGSLAAQTEVSTLHKAIKQDLLWMYETLAKQIDGVLNTASVTLENSEKILADSKDLKEATKEVSSKVGKVNDAVDKIATTTQSYRNVLAQRPLTANNSSLDPKVLGDMERKARQILIDIFDDNANNVLSKSITEVIVRANKALDKIDDAEKPDKVKVESALQSCKGALILTLNSKEAVTWLKQPEHKMAFTEGFSKGSHIRERSFNLIIPRVPIVFKPENRTHHREIEEVNGLKDHSIRKVRWIKPVARRHMGQMHAYAVLTVSSAKYANTLIRDGLIVCGTRVRPEKQKMEPIQCMKCRKWGHFAGECTASDNTCGTCGGEHCTNTCQNRSKLWCVSCQATNHASWDRNCPEFQRRCYLVDKQNPENSMPYFPME